MVYADTDGCVVLLADIKERHEAVTNLLKFLCIFLVGIFQFLEDTCRINIVARVHAHLLAIKGSHIGHVGVEVNVGHEWCHDSLCLQRSGDILHVLCLARALCGKSHEFTSSLNDTLCLCHTSLRVIGVGSGHGLHPYWVLGVGCWVLATTISSTYYYISNLCRSC